MKNYLAEIAIVLGWFVLIGVIAYLFA